MSRSILSELSVVESECRFGGDYLGFKQLYRSLPRLIGAPRGMSILGMKNFMTAQSLLLSQMQTVFI
jgi:hypothetical protein